MFTLLVIYFNPPRQNKPKQIAGTAFHPKKKDTPAYYTRYPFCQSPIYPACPIQISFQATRALPNPYRSFQIPAGFPDRCRPFQAFSGYSRPTQVFQIPADFPRPTQAFPSLSQAFPPTQASSILPQPPDTEFSALKHINLTVILLYNDP